MSSSPRFWLAWCKVLIFAVALGGLGIGMYVFLRTYVWPWSGLGRMKNWQNVSRPHIEPPHPSLGQSGLPACLLMVPGANPSQPVISDSIGDCLALIPDGQQYDLFEIGLADGSLFTPVKTDLYLPGSPPLAFTRFYHLPDDLTRRYHVWLWHSYDVFLSGDRSPYTYMDVDVPGDLRFHYNRVSPGTAFSDSVCEHTATLTRFYHSQVAWNGNGWNLSFGDGSTYVFPEAANATTLEQGALVGVADGNGNLIGVERNWSGKVVKIESKDGRWIRLDYDYDRISRARDSAGDWVSYAYDDRNRLQHVTDSRGGMTEYFYDSGDQLIKGTERRQPDLEASYDQDRWIRELVAGKNVLGSDLRYEFRYVTDQRGNFVGTDMTRPNGEVMHVLFQDGHYSVTEN